MIRITNITIRNFLSVGNVTQTIELDSDGLTLILGKNLDVGGGNSRNGVGKTSLLQAISYGLYGEPISNIRLDNLINGFNQKNMLVSIEFKRDGNAYRIERGRKPNVMRLFVNDACVNDKKNMTNNAEGENKHTQTEIDRLIGMSHGLFQHIVAMNTYTIPFLRLKPGPQREVIEELLGFTTLSNRDKVLMDVIRVTKERLRDEEARIKATGDANGRIEKAIERAEGDRLVWVASHEASLTRLRDQITKLDALDFDAELVVFDNLDAWNEQERELRVAAETERRAAEMMRRDVLRLHGEISRLKREAQEAVHDPQIARLAAEARRCDSEASKDIMQQVGRLEAEIRRCEQESEGNCDDQVDRLRSDIARRERDAAAKLQISETRLADLRAVLKEIEHTDSHTCSTCGQGLEGTDHLQVVLANLAVKAEKLEKEAECAAVEAEKLLQEASAIEKEIEKTRRDHDHKRREWMHKAEAIRSEITEMVAAHEKHCLEWLAKAAMVRSEMDDAKNSAERRRSEILGQIDVLEADTAAVMAEIATHEQTAAEILTAIKLLGTKPTSSYPNREAIWTLRETRDRLRADLDREMTLVNPHDAHIESLRSTLSKIDHTDLNEIQSLLKHQDFVHKLLSSKDSFARKKIIDKSLMVLNGRLNHYLEALGLPHEVTFRPDLSVEISHLGREFDFEQLSRGEMNRVMLATSWSFRDMWEGLNDSLNLLFVDEMVDSGLDESGSEAALAVLSRMTRRNVFLISHKDNLIGRVNRILLVKKENEFTQFESNADPQMVL